MERFESLIKRLVQNLNDARLDYMLTGAIAASYYGTPRTTMDIDIIVKVKPGEKPISLLSALKKSSVKVDEKKIETAIESDYKIVSLEDQKSPFTLDIIFSLKDLEKRAGTILGLSTFYQTPEALILTKLRMIKATFPPERALKDKEDIKAILKFTETNLDYIKREAQKENTLTIFETIIYE